MYSTQTDPKWRQKWGLDHSSNVTVETPRRTTQNTSTNRQVGVKPGYLENPDVSAYASGDDNLN
jgi:hypothetical protein